MKKRVKEMFPKAFAHFHSRHDSWVIYIPSNFENIAIGGGKTPSLAWANASESIPYYPTTVDAKTLAALINTGNSIIRKPEAKRIEFWKKVVDLLRAQQATTSLLIKNL